jgi:hypothetical protein
VLIQAIVHAADIQDRDGGILLMSSLFGLYPFLLKLYADGGYQGNKFRDGLAGVCKQVNDRDRRAHHRLAQLLPPTGQGLGVPQPQRSCFPPMGLHPPHAPKALPNQKLIPDGL